MKRSFHPVRLLLLLVVTIVAIVAITQIGIFAFNATYAYVEEHLAKVNTEESEFDIKPCGANEVRVDVHIKDPIVTYAEGLHLIVKTTYTGTNSCTVRTDLQNRILTITRGGSDGEKVYSSEACKVDESGLLLGPGDSTEQEITWNAHGTGEDGCATGDTQPIAYYSASITYADSPDLKPPAVSFSIGIPR